MNNQIIAMAAGLLLSSLAYAPALAAGDMFRCEDGTFTNRPELLCEPYEPQGVVISLPEGATLASAKRLVAELGSQAESRTRIPDPAGVCDLYKEWTVMNLRTGGGQTFAVTQDIPRWLALSRIFTAIGAPHCP